MAKKLTENQEKFLEVLFDEAGGDFVAAKRLAGYSENTPTRLIVDALQDEIFEATKKYMSRMGPKAAVALGRVLDDPTELGVKEKMAAAKDLLDRMGIVKTEKVEVASSGGLFILPSKDADVDDAD